MGFSRLRRPDGLPTLTVVLEVALFFVGFLPFVCLQVYFASAVAAGYSSCVARRLFNGRALSWLFPLVNWAILAKQISDPFVQLLSDSQFKESATVVAKVVLCRR